MKKILTVNEFSKLTGIEKTTLRYWDDIGLFSPTVRDPETNYRGYTIDQYSAVNFITILSKLNIPLKTINVVKQNRTPARIVHLLEKHEKNLDAELRRLLESYSVIHERLRMMRYGMEITNNNDSCVPDFTIRHMPEGKYILGPSANTYGDDRLYNTLVDFRKSAENMRINLSYPIGSYYQSMNFFVDDPGAPSNLFSSDPHGNKTWAAGDYLTGYARGSYGDFGDVPSKMMAYAAEHKLELTGPVFQMYLHDEICISDPSQYLSQFSVACTQPVR